MTSCIIEKCRVLMRLCCFMVLSAGCSRSSNPMSGIPSNSDALSFDASITRFLASKDEYAAGEHWDATKRALNLSRPDEVERWFDLQKLILTNRTAVYAPQSVQRSAIQEFYTLFDYARPYENWLKSNKDNGMFIDPFITQNVDMVLQVLRKTAPDAGGEPATDGKRR